MAKVSKSLLKEIVKECLVEILAEGISGGNVTSLTENIQSVSSTSSRKSKIMKNMLPPKQKVINKKFESNLDKVISNSTKDPIMAELLADTAKTTLQEQNSADSANKFTAKATDSVSRKVADSSPEELFGEAASSWAQLAFSDSNK